MAIPYYLGLEGEVLAEDALDLGLHATAGQAAHAVHDDD